MQVILKISSQVVASNLDDFAANVKAEIAKIKTDLTTRAGDLEEMKRGLLTRIEAIREGI